MTRRSFLLAGAAALVVPAVPAEAAFVPVYAGGGGSAGRRRRLRELRELEESIKRLEHAWRLKQWGVSAERVAGVQSRTAQMLTPKPGPTNPSLWFVFLSAIGAALLMIAGGIYLESER